MIPQPHKRLVQLRDPTVTVACVIDATNERVAQLIAERIAATLRRMMNDAHVTIDTTDD